MKLQVVVVALLGVLLSVPALAQTGMAPSHSSDRVEEWIAALRWPDSDVREGAARALGTAGDTRAVKPLTRALKDRSGLVRSAAAWSLGELGADKSAEALADLCNKDGYSPARAEAARSLGKLGKGEKALKKALGDRADAVRAAAAEALPYAAGQKSVEDLRKVLGDGAWQVRLAAAASLGTLKSDKAVDSLVHTLNADDHEYVRAGAAKALGRIGDNGSVAALKTAASDDPSGRVRKEAMIALVLMRVDMTPTGPQPTFEAPARDVDKGHDTIDL